MDINQLFPWFFHLLLSLFLFEGERHARIFFELTSLSNFAEMIQPRGKIFGRHVLLVPPLQQPTVYKSH